ncbi:hypothetical protein HKD22_10190 [Gluconobacter kanchanaburiensis]|nr:hypothetical protein [Gluconobacter kanchanaburiensis]
MLAAVILMGVLIIAAVFGLIGVIAYRFLHPRPSVTATVPLVEGGFSRLALPLQEGEHITAVTARPDGLMAVTLGGVGRDRVLLWNPEAGKIAAELDFGAPASAAP